LDIIIWLNSLNIKHLAKPSIKEFNLQIDSLCVPKDPGIIMVRANTVLIEGPIGRNLVLLTSPMVFGTIGMVIFYLADTHFVGQLGTDQLAAMSFTYQAVLFRGGCGQRDVSCEVSTEWRRSS